jgi:tRNA(fMet)-specific endonuclease VapC
LNYQLDTNAVIAILKNRPHPVRERLERAYRSGAKVALGSIVLFELSFGVARCRRAENAARLKEFLESPIEVLEFGVEDGARAGELRATLERRGTPIGPYDILIAAQALRPETTLVTASTREFSRVPGLRWEDWSLPD